MFASLEVESTLTDRYQTTVPETVRGALRLGKRDKILYTIRPGGEGVLARDDSADNDDPVLAHFLDFLARDMSSHPERLQAIDADLVTRIHALADCMNDDDTRRDYVSSDDACRVFKKTLENGHPR